MKPKLLKFTALLLVVAGVFAACKKTETDPKEPEPTYPVVISYEEYDLEETSCQWKNLPYDEKVILINSDEALENYISCAKSSYPEIDFSKKSLLLISGKTTTGIDKISKSITQLSANNFKIDLEIELAATAAEEWCIVLVISKINYESLFEINVTYKESIYPIDVPFTKLNISCLWSEEHYPWIGTDTLSIFNTNAEFEENADCLISNYPGIDFAKHTLWATKGYTATEINNVSANIQQVSSKKYRLNVNVELKGTTFPSKWRIELLTEKIGEKCEIEYNVNVIN